MTKYKNRKDVEVNVRWL